MGGFRRSWLVTWTGVGQKTLTTRLPSSLVPTEPSVTLLDLTVTWHNSQAPAGQKSKVRSFIYGASMRENLWFLGKKVKNWKFSKFCFWPNQGHTEVKWGQFGSLKVIEGHLRSLEVELFIKSFKIDYFKFLLKITCLTLNDLKWPSMTSSDLASDSTLNWLQNKPYICYIYSENLLSGSWPWKPDIT